MYEFGKLTPKQQLIWILENEDKITPEMYAQIYKMENINLEIKEHINDVVNQYKILASTELGKEYSSYLKRFNVEYRKQKEQTTNEFE